MFHIDVLVIVPTDCFEPMEEMIDSMGCPKWYGGNFWNFSNVLFRHSSKRCFTVKIDYLYGEDPTGYQIIEYELFKEMYSYFLAGVPLHIVSQMLLENHHDSTKS